MYNEKKGHKSMRIVPLYDCGNICTLNLSTEKIKNNGSPSRSEKNIHNILIVDVTT